MEQPRETPIEEPSASSNGARSAHHGVFDSVVRERQRGCRLLELLVVDVPCFSLEHPLSVESRMRLMQSLRVEGSSD